jgi:hypothetical protein
MEICLMDIMGWISKQAKRFSMAALYAGGLLLAGSDGSWFPWANFAGIGLLFIFAVIANQVTKKQKGEISCQ